MKKLGKLMEELGFDPNGSDAVKKAFIKNLIREAGKKEEIPVEEVTRISQSGTQLEFPGLYSQNYPKKK